MGNRAWTPSDIVLGLWLSDRAICRAITSLPDLHGAAGSCAVDGLAGGPLSEASTPSTTVNFTAVQEGGSPIQGGDLRRKLLRSIVLDGQGVK